MTKGSDIMFFNKERYSSLAKVHSPSWVVSTSKSAHTWHWPSGPEGQKFAILPGGTLIMPMGLLQQIN
jgi:hypothetical protein